MKYIFVILIVRHIFEISKDDVMTTLTLMFIFNFADAELVTLAPAYAGWLGKKFTLVINYMHELE